MSSNFTPGPWRWELNERHRGLCLCGAAGYDLTVMDFVRWGMGSAAPRFRTEVGGAPQVMVRAESFGVVVPGREHHAEWFKTVNHPDAALIASAPELLEALEAAVECGMVPTSSANEGGAHAHVRQLHVADQIRAAIAKARGVK